VLAAIGNQMEGDDGIGNGRHSMVAPMGACVESAEDGLAAGAAESGQRPRSGALGITFSDQLACQAFWDPLFAAIQLGVQLKNSLSRLEVNKVHPFVFIGVFLVKLVGREAFEEPDNLRMQAFGHDVIPGLVHRLEAVVGVVSLDEGVVTDGGVGESPVASRGLQVLAGWPGLADFNYVSKRTRVVDGGNGREQRRAWQIVLSRPRYVMKLRYNHKIALPPLPVVLCRRR